MKRMLLLFMGLCFSLASQAVLAQEKRIEVNGVVGYSFSSGVDVTPQEYEGKTVDRLTPTSGAVFDVGVDVFLSEDFALGFNVGQQRGNLRGRVRNGADIDFTKMKTNNYHGIFTYNWGDDNSPVRPYMFGGIGATHYKPSDIGGNSIESRTKFSTTWGGGVKLYTSEHFGFKGGVRWTPTYIKTTAGGIWCSPWWPWSCWVLGNDHFTHQFELTGGIVVRF